MEQPLTTNKASRIIFSAIGQKMISHSMRVIVDDKKVDDYVKLCIAIGKLCHDNQSEVINAALSFMLSGNSKSYLASSSDSIDQSAKEN